MPPTRSSHLPFFLLRVAADRATERTSRRPAIASQHEGPLVAYRRLRRDGELKPDPAQRLAVEKLEALYRQIEEYDPGAHTGWKAFFQRSRRFETPPQGLYLYGDVGRGKSMLMDLLFAAVSWPEKRRVHFNAFMLEVHAKIHRWRQTPPERREGDDPIPPLARGIAEAARLLCFDEFQVSDVADAMILGRLFEHLFDHGVVVVATSNRPPDDLYLNGLNRQLFLPFIALFKSRLDVLHLEGRSDYRRTRLAGEKVYFMPLDQAAEDQIERLFRVLTDDAPPAAETLTLPGRTLVVPMQAKGVARMSFADLCDQPLGAADYLALAARYHTLVLAGVPQLRPEQKSAALRFVLLIDSLYEARTKLICSAAVPPTEIYAASDASFESARTISRLIEMQSRDYLEHIAEKWDPVSDRNMY